MNRVNKEIYYRNLVGVLSLVYRGLENSHLQTDTGNKAICAVVVVID